MQLFVDKVPLSLIMALFCGIIVVVIYIIYHVNEWSTNI
nr:MAG TPA: hypothetical protein [Caudoviricetes sp.]